MEMILDDRFNEELQRKEWLVKWEGYTVEESTWEPLENVDGNVKFADYQDAKAVITSILFCFGQRIAVDNPEFH